MYSVINEASALKKMKLRMNALYMVEPATGPPQWLPPSTELCRQAIGDTSQLTRQFTEVLNGDSDNFSQCPAPWDDDYLAKHCTEAGETGQTFDEWSALLIATEPTSTVAATEMSTATHATSSVYATASPTTSPSPSTSKKSTPIKRSSVDELRKDYRVLHAKHHPSPQQIWKKDQIKQAKKDRHEEMLLTGKTSMSELNTWSCTVCNHTNIAPNSFTCPECGAAPAQPLGTPEEKSDGAIKRSIALAQLRRCSLYCLVVVYIITLHLHL